MVQLALHLDHQRKLRVTEVDPADPPVAAGVDLPAHAWLAGTLEHGLEPPLEVAIGWHVIVAALVEQLAHGPDAVAALLGELVERAAQRPARREAPPPQVVERPGSAVGVLVGAQLQHHQLGPDDWHPIEDGDVVGAQAGELVQHRHPAAASREAGRPRHVHRHQAVARHGPQGGSGRPARERLWRRVEHRREHRLTVGRRGATGPEHTAGQPLEPAAGDAVAQR